MGHLVHMGHLGRAHKVRETILKIHIALKQIISYVIVARSEPKIHANLCKIMPHTFPHVLGEAADEGVLGCMWKGMRHG